MFYTKSKILCYMTSTIGLPRDKSVKRNNKIAGVDDLSICGCASVN